MKYTEDHKQQLRDFLKEGLVRVVSYFYTTHGLPPEFTLERIHSMKTQGEQMIFLENAYKRYPHIFNDMPHFKP